MIAPRQFERDRELGLAYEETGKPREALDAFLRAIRKNGEDPSLRLGAGDLYVRLGESEEAAEQFEEAGELFAAAGETDEAIQSLDKALQLDPDLDEATELRAQLSSPRE
jgi:tetratricopeptide (TPR) repeat protein